MSETNPLAPAPKTLEGKLSIATVAVSLLVALFAQAAPLFQSAAEQLPGIGWLRTLATILGLVSAAATTLGLQAQRTGLKRDALAAIEPGALPPETKVAVEVK